MKSQPSLKKYSGVYTYMNIFINNLTDCRFGKGFLKGHNKHKLYVKKKSINY